MRYSEDIPHEELSKYASDDMLLFTAFISIFVSFALLYMGIKGKQLWMIPWGIGLFFVSIVMGTAIYFEVDYLGY
jgi:hypothetical protein